MQAVHFTGENYTRGSKKSQAALNLHDLSASVTPCDFSDSDAQSYVASCMSRKLSTGKRSDPTTSDTLFLEQANLYNGRALGLYFQSSVGNFTSIQPFCLSTALFVCFAEPPSSTCITKKTLLKLTKTKLLQPLGSKFQEFGNSGEIQETLHVYERHAFGKQFRTEHQIQLQKTADHHRTPEDTKET